LYSLKRGVCGTRDYRVSVSTHKIKTDFAALTCTNERYAAFRFCGCYCPSGPPQLLLVKQWLSQMALSEHLMLQARQMSSESLPRSRATPHQYSHLSADVLYFAFGSVLAENTLIQHCEEAAK
jgi:hypothetical protein